MKPSIIMNRKWETDDLNEIRHPKVIGVGASTGGIDALCQLLSGISPNTLPILVVQHTRGQKRSSLVQLLERKCPAIVIPASQGIPIQRGRVYVACGNEEHLMLSPNDPKKIDCSKTDPASGHRPSIDKLFQSLSELGPQSVGILLTGMGRDGASGLKLMRERGAYTIGQDKHTSFVYGMPRVAFEEGAVCDQLSLTQIGPIINSMSGE